MPSVAGVEMRVSKVLRFRLGCDGGGGAGRVVVVIRVRGWVRGGLLYVHSKSLLRPIRRRAESSFTVLHAPSTPAL